MRPAEYGGTSSTCSSGSIDYVSDIGPTMWSISDFEEFAIIKQSKGTTTFRATERLSQGAVAIKRISKAYTVRNQLWRDVERELHVHEHLHHPHVIRLYCWFHDPKYIYLVMEYANCSLSELLAKRYPKGIPVQLVKSVSRQLLSAMSYMHSLNIIHRDVKPGNVFLVYSTNDCKVKLGDFGCSVHSRTGDLRQTVCGSLPYMSPEILKGSGHSFATDIWSLGVTVHELLTGELPFDGATPQRLCKRIVREEYIGLAVADTMMRELIGLCLSKNPNDRPTVEMLLKRV